LHLVRRACHLRDKDGGRTSIRSAIAENHMLHAKLRGSSFYGNGVIADQSYTLREYGFLTLIAPVSLTLIR